MAHLKKAFAGVVHPNWGTQNWERFREEHRAQLVGGPYRTASASSNLVAQASEILQDTFTPDRYLLTHATIVASVDTEDVPNVKLGAVSELGRNINRKWANYRVQPSRDIYINNNHDCWDRPVLLKSYRTFIGAHNFVEHVQIEEQSKGRIIDAAARDLGDSIYVDILIATDRKHEDLVRQIQAGQMGTMSMGCFLAGTQVTMADGTRVAIEDVVPGDMVLTHKGRAREVLNKQIRTYRGELRYIKAVGVSSTIRTTANHGFHVLQAPKTCACGCGEDLPTAGTLTRRTTRRFKRGHDKRIFNPNNTYSLEEARRRKDEIEDIKSLQLTKVRADELSVGDFLAFPRSAEGVGAGWTPGKARLVGYFLAEGSYLKRKGEHIEVQFNFSMSERDTYAHEVADLLRQEFPTANEPWVQERPERDTSVVHMTGRDAVAWFLQHCGEYSHGKRMSQEVMALPVELHRHVVGAWVNGDGTFGDANKTLSGTTVSYDLGCQMHSLFSRCGVFARMECQQDGRNIEIAQAVGSDWMPNPETGKRPAITLVMGLTGQQGLAGFSDKVGRESQAEQQLRMLDDYVIFPITSIESDVYEGPVHNMEVEEDHTYVVEGVTAYNCSVTETICTKCGNVAADETEMCEHVKYAKGNYEFDAHGRKFRVAELCGHDSLDPTGGVTFIEASWVAVPAFAGASLRNILGPDQVNVDTRSQMQQVLASPPREWTDEGMPKAARGMEIVFDEATRTAADLKRLRLGQDDMGAPPGGDMGAPPGGDMGAPGGMPMDPAGGLPGAPGGEPEKDPMEEMEDELEKYVLDKVKKRLQEKMQEDVSEDAASAPDLATSSNENINHQAALVKGARVVVRTARSDVALIDGLARLNESHGVKISRDIYRTALRVGSTDGHPSLDEFLRRCAGVLDRKPTLGEAKTLVRLGRILSLRKKTTRL